MNEKNSILAVIIFSVAILGAGFLIGSGLSKMRSSTGTVSVRGLSEREVNADLAIWPMTFSVSGDDLRQVQSETLRKIEVVKNYLSQFNFSPDEVTVKEPAITDTTANPYMNANERRNKYFAKTTIIIRSSNVEAVKMALSKSIDLLGEGVAIIQDYDSRISFDYTALNSIKPEMIAEATKNARVAAEQFANDSGSKVGRILNATQGLFSIESVDASLPDKMSVRVVTTVVYELK